MEIYIGHYSYLREIVYILYEGNERYSTDFAISKYLGLDKKEYKKKIKANRSSYYRLHGWNLFKANSVRWEVYWCF